MMGEPVQAYRLCVNQQRLPDVFTTLEEAKDAATPHLQKQEALRIETTWGQVRTWNYRYDLKQWVEMMRG